MLVVKDLQGMDLTIHEQELIENEIKRYYNDLYDNKDEFITKNIGDFIAEDTP